MPQARPVTAGDFVAKLGFYLDHPEAILQRANGQVYFDAETQMRVLEGMHRVMRPGALLFAGHSENFSQARTLFRLRGKTVYERL